MMVKLYVDWSGGVILNEKQAYETASNGEHYRAATSDDSFDDWLSVNYSYVDLFNMKEDEKERLRTEFLREMKETAWQDFLSDGYEEVSVEI